MNEERICQNCEYSWIDFKTDYDEYWCPFSKFVQHSGDTCDKFCKSRFLVMVDNGIL